MNKNILLISLLLILGLGTFGLYYALSADTSVGEPDENVVVVIEENYAVTGELTCLPKIGSGAQTMECAIGLLSVDGRYYSLIDLGEFDPEYSISMNVPVEITGRLTDEIQFGPDGNQYNTVGTVNLTGISVVGE